MAYKKNFKKRAFKKRPSRWGVYKRFGSQLWKDVKMLKSIINVEYKDYEVDTAFTNVIQSSGASAAIFTPVRGVDWNNVNGRSLKVVSLQGYINFVNSLGTNVRIRCAVVLDKQGGRNIGISNVWSNPVPGFRNLDEKRDIVILKEWDEYLCPNGSTPAKQKNFYKKLNMHVQYNATNGGTYADTDNNQLFFVAVTDQSVNGVSIGYSFRTRFIDN